MAREYLSVGEGMVRRPRVEALLRRGLEAPLITVVAAPGYGKTVAVAQFARNLRRRLAWLHLLRLDNDPGRFWRRLTEATRRELPGLAKEMEQLRLPDTAGQFDAFLHLLAREAYRGDDVVLVLDSFEVIENHAIHDFLEQLLKARLENLCIFLLSSDKLRLGALVNDGRMFAVDSGDLRFTPEEIGDLCKAHGNGRLSEAQRGEIAARTDGWPLAVHLLCNKRGWKDGGDHDPLGVLTQLFQLGYFEGYDTDLRDLLVKMSLFPRFSLGIIRDLGDCDTQKAMEALSYHPFLTYDFSTGFYSFQAMYREFLAAKQQALGLVEIRRANRVAGSWFLQNGNLLLAMDCFWSVADYDRYLEAAVRMIPGGIDEELAGHILRRLEQLPSEVEEGSPRGQFLRGYLHLCRGEFALGQEVLLRLAARLEEEGAPGEEARLLLGDLYASLASAALRNNDIRCMDYIKKAALYTPQGCRIRSREQMAVGNNALFFLPDNRPGQRVRMVEFMQEYALYADRVYRDSGAGFHFLFAAEAALLAGDLDIAKSNGMRAVLKAAPKGQHDIVCGARWVELRARVYQGDYRHALQTLGELDKYLETRESASLAPLQDCIHAWFFIQMGEPDRVAGWIAERGSAGSRMPLEPGRIQNICAWYLMAKGRYREAYGELIRLEEAFVQQGLWSSRLLALLQKACVLQKIGLGEGAEKALWKACDISRQNRIVTPFAEQGEWMLELLEIAAQSRRPFDPGWLALVEEETRAFLLRRSAMRRLHGTGQAAHRGKSVSLTAREQEVLEHLANGMTREEISALLGISVHGVKKHITGIYNKLGAVNRAEAVHIALSGGLLPP